MVDVLRALNDIAGAGDSREQATKYKALVDGLAVGSDVEGLKLVLSRLLSDAVPQVISRNVVAHYANAVAKVKVRARKRERKAVRDV